MRGDYGAVDVGEQTQTVDRPPPTNQPAPAPALPKFRVRVVFYKVIEKDAIVTDGLAAANHTIREGIFRCCSL